MCLSAGLQNKFPSLNRSQLGTHDTFFTKTPVHPLWYTKTYWQNSSIPKMVNEARQITYQILAWQLIKHWTIIIGYA